MAIDKIVEGAVQRVAEAFKAGQADVVALRDALANRAATCLTTVEDGQKADDWIAVADEGTVSFSPRTDEGQPLLINGKTTTFWSTADIAGTVRAFRQAVERGEFDDQLAAGGQPTVSPKIEGEKLPADPDNGSLSTGGGRTSADETETLFTEGTRK